MTQGKSYKTNFFRKTFLNFLRESSLIQLDDRMSKYKNKYLVCYLNYSVDQVLLAIVASEFYYIYTFIMK